MINCDHIGGEGLFIVYVIRTGAEGILMNTNGLMR